MCSNDAAKPSLSTIHQEEGEECLFAAKPWNHQGEEKGEESRTRNLERADYHAYLANAVCLFSFVLQVPKDMMLMHLLQTTDARFYCSTAANHDGDASRTRTTSKGGGGAQGETTATGPPSRYHSTCSSITCSLTCFRSFLTPPLKLSCCLLIPFEVLLAFFGYHFFYCNCWFVFPFFLLCCK